MATWLEQAMGNQYYPGLSNNPFGSRNVTFSQPAYNQSAAVASGGITKPVPVPTQTKGDVLGTSTDPWALSSKANMSYDPNRFKTSGGGGGGDDRYTQLEKIGSARNPKEETEYNLLKDQIASNVGFDQDAIDRDYEAAMSQAAGSENVLRSEHAAGVKGIEAGYAPARTAIGEEQATREAGLTKEEQTATKSSESAMREARDVARQVQQRNIAQLSALGLSSSSVAEGLAEKLGVETARRITGITGSRDEILQNIAQERTRMGTFYKQKLTDLEGIVAAKKQELQVALMQGLDRINNIRNMAAVDKANRRAEVAQNARNALTNLEIERVKMAQAMSDWATKRAAALEDAKRFVVDPTDYSAMNREVSRIADLPRVGGMYAVPDIQPSQYGVRITPRYVEEQKKDDYEAWLEQQLNQSRIQG